MEGQVVRARGLGPAPGVERHRPAPGVDHRRPGRAALGARRGLQVERVEVVVAAAAVDGRVAVQPGEGAGEDRDLLAAVVADDADVEADGGSVGGEGDLVLFRFVSFCFFKGKKKSRRFLEFFLP